MSTGWIKLGDIWYYLESSGAIKTGWWNNYYFGSDGAMRTGWQLIDNKWYYFYIVCKIYLIIKANQT